MLKRKVSVITGASQGLGKEIAKKLAAEGSVVVLLARTESLLKKRVAEIQSAGGIASYVICDIRDRTQVASAVSEVITRHDHIDILVNNAGIWTDNDIDNKDPERNRVALETNTLGHIQMIQEVLPHMKKNRSGHILNVISTAAVSDTPSGDNQDWQTYGATKWAMRGYTKDLKNSLQGTGIKVSALYPGGFESNLYENAGHEPSRAHNQPWMMKTEDVADLVIFCLTRPKDMLIETLVATKCTE